MIVEALIEQHRMDEPARLRSARLKERMSYVVAVASGAMLALLLWGTVAFVQPAVPQPPDPAFLQQAVQSLQAQRNEAMDRAAIADANHRMASAEVEKLKGQIAILTKELADAKAKVPPPPVAAK
jgi:hypothetical protein